LVQKGVTIAQETPELFAKKWHAFLAHSVGGAGISDMSQC